ncbi:MAG TPA: M20/M25/M40 family metallo-hydrolase, partial [Longimicrobiales bacterium]
GRRRRGTRALTLELEVIGDRPTGETPPDAALVRAARAATRFIGHTPELVASSTDANVPIALGIPAIAMGAGGESGGMHTVHEWYSNENGVEGLERALLTVLAVAGLAS